MNNYNSNSGGGGAAVFVFVIIAIIIGLVVANSSNTSSSSSYTGYDDYIAPSYEDYDVSDYVDELPEQDYDDYNYDYEYEDPSIVTWDCVDTTSYDKNPYNDNYCVSSDGRQLYVPDSQAETLDPYYTAGTSGHSYYNSF